MLTLVRWLEGGIGEESGAGRFPKNCGFTFQQPDRLLKIVAVEVSLRLT